MPQNATVNTAGAVKVSVITRTKNRAFFLERARAGLAAQTFKNFEWIVVNDGGVQADIASVLSSPVGSEQAPCFVNLPESLGRAGAAIAGLDIARGDYCLIHDDDDALLPRALEDYVTALDAAPKAVAAIGGVKTITEKPAAGGYEPYGKPAMQIPQNNPLLMDLAYRNSFMTISTLFRKNAYIKAGGINPDLDVLEDWDLWLRLMLEGDVICVPQILSLQYVRKGETGDAAQSSRKDHLKTDIALRNHYLRQDIQNGTFGLGHMMNLHHRQTLEEISAMMKVLRRVKKRLFFWR